MDVDVAGPGSSRSGTASGARESGGRFGSDRRGQTPIDFAIGAGVFVVAVAFVVTFTPTLLEPFEEGAGGQTVAADAAATELAEGLLGAPTDPYVLDLGCTTGFFADTSTHCGYDPSAGLKQEIGVRPVRNVQVELLGDPDDDGTRERLCYDRSAGQVRAAAGCGSPDTRFVAGETPGSTASITDARRAVSIDGTPAVLHVRTW